MTCSSMAFTWFGVAAVVACACLSATIVLAQRPDAALLNPLYYNPTVDTLTKQYYEGSVLALWYYVENTGMDRVGWDTVYLELSEEMLGLHFDKAYYALGYAEGLETQRRMFQMFTNLYPPYWNFAAQWDPPMQEWVMNQTKYLRAKVAAAGGSSRYWRTIGGILQQVDGLVAGYNAAAPANETLSWMEVYALTLWFEMYDIRDATSLPNGEFESDRERGFQVPSRLRRNMQSGHCSGFIKVTENDIFFAHDTWTPYNNMLRQYKVYNLTGIRAIAFSSYPGTLHSGDDWYLLSNGLTVMETSIDNFNASSYQFISHASAPEFIRVMTANTISTADGANWTATFCEENGGTYNNQYMVLNMNLFTPGSALPNGTLWLLEQMPLHCQRADITSVLAADSYFGSYNIPYFPTIFAVSGTQAYEDTYGTFFSYTKYCRGEIFHRNQSDVRTLTDAKELMRYNDFRHDPYSLIPNCSGTTTGSCVPPYDASLSIASRMDLNPPGSSRTLGPLWGYFRADYMGAIDSKVARWSDLFPRGLLSASGSAWLVGHLVSGPTVEPRYGIPPFQWSTSQWEGISHVGIPDFWNYSWINSTALLAPIPPPV